MGLTSKGAVRRHSKVEVLERPQYGWIWKPLLVLLAVYLVVTLALGVWWSRTPANLDMPGIIAEQEANGTGVQGMVTVSGLQATLESLLNKPGGYLRNDIAPPGLWLDNMSAWEFGVLRQSRGLVSALAEQEGDSTSGLESAVVSLRGKGRDWFYPSTEHHVRQAVDELEAYRTRLGETDESGFAGNGRALALWLDQVAESLDALGGRLSASVGDRQRLAELGVAVASLPEPTPWYRVDDVFFEARGQAWALRHLLVAVRHDHVDALEATGLSKRWDALTAELERSQRSLWSPVVLNGSGFGIFANHSLVMASHMLKARDLVRELSAGLSATAAGESSQSASAQSDSGAAESPMSASAEASPQQAGE